LIRCRRRAWAAPPVSADEMHGHKGEDGMTKLFTLIRVIIGALALGVIVAAVTPASAQQVDPAASAVKEQQLLQTLSKVKGLGTIPDVTSYVIEHPAGRSWREWHEVTLRWIGAVVILGAILLLVIFYLVRGSVRLERGRSAIKIVRFTAFERFIHWMTAACFIVQAITGLNITFGRSLLLPLLGPQAFASWSQWAKYAHNFLSFPFTIGVVLVFLIWIGGNIPNSADVEWFKRGGGIFSDDHPPAYRFNAGQKAIFWIQVLGGTAMVVSGYVLIFPFYGTDISNMQLAEIVHAGIAMFYIAAMIGHIYIGSLGMEGAFEGMGEGTVDLNWAKEHHSLWLAEVQRGEGKPQSAATQPAE
jgi:formate dehydrogenase subunit gamma